MKFSLALLSLVAFRSVVHGQGDDHDESESCACAGERMGKEIDCSDQQAMIDAFAFMNGVGSCATNCETDACEAAWFTVQAHHDYCPEGSVPSEIEDGFHNYDDICHKCDISRQFDDSAPDCAAPNCMSGADGAGNQAYGFLLENDCGADCTSQNCIDAFTTLRVVHDNCDESALSEAAEEGIHDFEEVCDITCNTPQSKTDQLTCSSGAASSATMGLAALLVVGAAAFFI